jgi:hypothetical protein
MVGKIFSSERGFIVVVLAAGAIIALFAFAGFAVDVGRAYVVKGELQKAADAAALAGAGLLYITNASSPPTLSWSNAESAATGFVGENTAENKALTEGEVESGYWDLAATSSNTLQPKGTLPGTCSLTNNGCSYNSDCSLLELCIQRYAPAVKVTVRKSPGNNGGAVVTFFARVVGRNDFQVGGSAIAVSGFAGTIPPGLAFPYVVPSCVINDYFSQSPLPNPPTEITSTSVYHLKNGSDAIPGQWSNLLPGKGPSAENIKDEYIENLLDPKTGEPSPATSVGDPIYIDPGIKASVYHKTQELIDAGKGLVYLPIVDCSITPDTTMQIRGYAAFQLTSTTNSSMTGHFVASVSSPPGAGPGGGSSNVISRPKLVK